MSGITDFLYGNGDVFGRTFDYFTDTDTASLSLVSQTFYRMTRYAEDRRPCRQLHELLQDLLKTNALSEDQRTKLQEISSGAARRIKDLSGGFDTVPIAGGRNYVDKMKCATAVALSWNGEALPVPKNRGLIHELCHVASVYKEAASAREELLQYLATGNPARPHKFFNLRMHLQQLRRYHRHYFEHVLDLFNTQEHIVPVKWCVLILQHVHNMLMGNSTKIASRICGQTCHLVANLSDDDLEGVEELCTMLLNHTLHLKLIEIGYPGGPKNCIMLDTLEDIIGQVLPVKDIEVTERLIDKIRRVHGHDASLIKPIIRVEIQPGKMSTALCFWW